MSYSCMNLTAVSNMLKTPIIRAEGEAEKLHGGTVGDVRKLSGMAETAMGEKLPFIMVLKTQKKWARQGDPDSWRREYDLYKSDFGTIFSGALRWPVCYCAEMNAEKNETKLWLEYIEGITGADLTVDMMTQAAYEIGRLQGRLYAEPPAFLHKLHLSKAGDLKSYYLYCRSQKKLYDCIRSNCEIPRHLCEMLICMDDNANEIWRCIERLPIVLCHRDFWVANIFHTDEGIRLIDWDTAGWGYLGEDIKSLIADEANPQYMAEAYQKCVPAYYKGFAEYSDAADIRDNCIYEMMLVNMGYTLAERVMNAKTPEKRALLAVLQKIYEIGQSSINS